MSGWRWGPAVRESVQNALAGWTRLVVVYAMVGGVVAAGGVLGQETSFSRTLVDLAERGRDVFVVASADPDRMAVIERRACEGLAARPDVERSGFVVPRGRLAESSIGRGTPLLGASVALVPELRDHPVVVGAHLGLPEGPRRVILSGAPVEVLVGGPSLPTIGAAAAVVHPLDPGVVTADHCVIVLSPWSDRDIAGEAAGSLVVSGAPVSVRAELTESVDVLESHRERPERLLPVAIGAGGALVWITLTGARPSRLSAYRLSGSRRRDVVRLLALESGLISGLYLTSGSLATLVLLGRSAASAAGVTWVLVGALCWYVLSTASWSLALLNPFDMGKDR